MWNHLPLILKNTVRNKRRTILTLASIAVSFCLLGFLLAVYNMFYFEGSSPNQALRMIVRNRVSLANPLPRSYQARIAQVPGVEATTIFQWFGGTYKDPREPKNFFARFAVEPEKFLGIYPEYKIEPGELKAFLGERTACVVGRKLARTHGFKVGDRVTVVGDIFPVTLNMTIRAMYDSERDNESMFFHFDYLNESVAKGRQDSVGTFVIRMASPDDATRRYRPRPRRSGRLSYRSWRSWGM
jgi:putative ABC transport system permease protein